MHYVQGFQEIIVHYVHIFEPTLTIKKVPEKTETSTHFPAIHPHRLADTLHPAQQPTQTFHLSSHPSPPPSRYTPSSPATPHKYSVL